MGALRRLIATAALAVGLIGVSAVPAFANDESISFYGAQVTYDDLTDTMCVFAANDTANFRDYALGYIVRQDGTTFRMEVDTQGNGWSCTGNMSIPEDTLYYLQVADCVDIPLGHDCGMSRRKAFYS